jgi:predicted DNA-binding transcriptional regulator YafY
MPVNRNALIRYKTIDQCLQNRYRTWTLDDLIEACSEALYEYEGIAKGVSKRTVQADIQMMRSEKIGYHAPIVVNDKKYYTYEDPDYSITKIPLTDKDLDKLGEVTEILKQFKGFSHFEDLGLMVQKLEDKLSAAKTQQPSVIEFEKNELLTGLEYIGILYRAIRNKQVLDVWYQSYKAKRPGKMIVNPYLLKEYRNRWFLVCKKMHENPILHLALDRIKDIDLNRDFDFQEDPDFDPATFHKDVIGVTVTGMRPVNVHLLFDHDQAPYVLTKPLHHSQKVVRESEKGVEINLKVKLNYELEREILGFGAGVEVLAPERLRKKIATIHKKAAAKYPDAC